MSWVRCATCAFGSARRVIVKPIAEIPADFTLETAAVILFVGGGLMQNGPPVYFARSVVSRPSR